MSLTPKIQRFVKEYVLDSDYTRAYSVAFGKMGRLAESSGQKLLKRDDVAQAIADLRANPTSDETVDPQRVLREAWLMLTADAREIISYKVGCCRHCHGEGNRYQRTTEEHNADFADWIMAGKAAEEFDNKGGIGFDSRRPPRTDCPECMGEGIGKAIIRDTRYLSPAAASLYAGVKVTKDGVQVLLHDKVAVLEKLMKHTGMYAEDNAQKATPLGEALKNFLGQIHGESAARVPFKPKVVGG